MKFGKVSIIIPTYGQAKVIDRAVRSALAQTYGNLEIVIADDHSPDETEKVIRESFSDKRINYFRNPTNLGRVGNYRKALYDYATGEWALNLDGDDYLTDDTFVEKAVELLARVENPVLLVGGQRFLEAGEIYKDCFPTIEEVEVLDGLDFFLRWCKPDDTVPHLSSLYHRATAMQIDFYRHDINSADWESLRRLILHGKVVLTKTIAGTWTGHEDNASKSIRLETHVQNLLSITEPYAYAVKKFGLTPHLQYWYRQAIAEYGHFYTNLALDQSQFGSAWTFLSYIREHYPDSFLPALSKLATNPKFYARALLGLAGPGIAERMRKTWLKQTWKRG
jgi:glycosyltransferase involved in cell wall biosynthesis